MTLHQGGDPKQAVAKLTRAIVLDSRNAELFKQRAEAFVSLGDYHMAIVNFRKVLSLSPSEEEEITGRLATVYHLHGEALVEQQQHDQALEMFRMASDHRPEEKMYTMRRLSLSFSSTLSFLLG